MITLGLDQSFDVSNPRSKQHLKNNCFTSLNPLFSMQSSSKLNILYVNFKNISMRVLPCVFFIGIFRSSKVKFQFLASNTKIVLLNTPNFLEWRVSCLARVPIFWYSKYPFCIPQQNLLCCIISKRLQSYTWRVRLLRSEGFNGQWSEGMQSAYVQWWCAICTLSAITTLPPMNRFLNWNLYLWRNDFV